MVRRGYKGKHREGEHVFLNGKEYEISDIYLTIYDTARMELEPIDGGESIMMDEYVIDDSQKRESKTMRMHGITVTHKADGTWQVSGRIDGRKWTETHKTFLDAGECAFEMADNNDFGEEINHKMCEVFNRLFFYD